MISMRMLETLQRQGGRGKRGVKSLALHRNLTVARLKSGSRPWWPIREEAYMNDAQKGPWNTDGKWGSMTLTQRIAFIGKFALALCTFGFVFPHILD
jgi:hypothetical protein